MLDEAINVDELFAQTQQDFEILAGTYACRKNAAETRTTRHEYYTFSALDVRPLHFERSGRTPGRRCNAEAAQASAGGVMVGIDANDRPAFQHQYTAYGFYETSYEWETSAVTSCHYGYSEEKEPINIIRVELRDGLPCQAVAWGVNGVSVEKYHYEAGLLSSVSLMHAAREAGVVAELSLARRETLTYDSSRRLIRVTWADAVRSGPGYSTRPECPVYERRERRIWRRGP